jgi:hypothetical protein
MDDGDQQWVRRGRTANTNVVVEAAIDFSKGANRNTWEAYRSRESSSISPWRKGGFEVDERFSEGSGPTEEIPTN